MIVIVFLLGLLAFSLTLGSLCGFLYGASRTDESYFLVSFLAISIVAIVASIVVSDVYGGVWETCDAETGCYSSVSNILFFVGVGIVVFFESTIAGMRLSSVLE